MKHIIDYVIIVLLAVAFTLVLGSNVGLWLVYVVVLIPMISAFMVMVTHKCVSSEISADKKDMKKNEQADISVKLKYAGFIPSSFIDVEFYADGHFDGETQKMRLIMFPRSEKTLTQTVTAKICGLGTAGVKSIAAVDILGLFRYRIYEEKGLRAESAEFPIMPDIPETETKNELIREINSAASDDDSEEADELSKVPSGFPGYEHREYVEGDPIKRINWKLSSRLGKLMLRLDEGISGTKQFIMLDPMLKDFSLYDTQTAYLEQERVLEGLLGVLQIITKLGREAVFYCCIKGKWTAIEVHNGEDVLKVQYMLAGYAFHTAIPSRVPPISPPIKMLTVFTTAQDYELISAAPTVCESHNIVCGALNDVHIDGIWVINKNYEFNKN